MTHEEIQQLLAVAPGHRRRLYEAALLSGLRGNELRQLAPDRPDTVECGLHLEAKWTKSRKQQFLPLPRILVERLRDNTAAAPAQYHRTYTCDCQRGEPQRSADPGTPCDGGIDHWAPRPHHRRAPDPGRRPDRPACDMYGIGRGGWDTND